MKRLMKAILWIVCYGGACWFGIKTKLGFDILNQKHWQILFNNRSPHAIWPSDMAPKKLVCKILLVFIIIGILSLAIVSKSRKRRGPIVKGEIPTVNSYRPAPMASQGRMSAPKPVSPAPSAPGEAPATPKSSGVTLMGEAVKRISEAAGTFDVSVFPHVKLENSFTQLIISDDSTALMLKILIQPGVWRIQQTPLPEESSWLLEGREPQFALKDILNSTDVLRRLEPESTAVPTVILTDGDIENPSELKTYLEQNGIRIVTLLPEGRTIQGIPTLPELLSEFYPKKGGEIKDETNQN